MKPTIFTWILAIFGATTFLPLMVAQFVMLIGPNSQRASDLIIGKGNTWRDRTHFRSALAFAWGDILWVLERSYTYPSVGGLAYYTYFRGFFLYWGIGATIYSAIILSRIL